MKYSLILATLISFSSMAAADVVCRGEVDTHTSNGVITDSLEMKASPAVLVGDILKLTGSLNGVFFSLTQRQAGGEDYLALISWGPEYLNGMTSTAIFDARNTFRASTVNEKFAARLVCSR